MSSLQKHVLIVAGGSGKRMKTSIPKQFLEINALPVLMHTFYAFLRTYDDLLFTLVLPGEQIDHWKNLCNKHHFKTEHKIVAGGKTRFHSVKNGLKYVKDSCIVAIHDGVRPLVSSKTIISCFEKAEAKGNAIPLIPLTESVRKKKDNYSIAVARNDYLIVQTPQVFKAEIIKKAYQQNYESSFSDDASVLEKAGYNIEGVEGNYENIKITHASDLSIASVMLSDFPSLP